jgi:uncharacterized pyridoxal phosphate-dependent enzyme
MRLYEQLGLRPIINACATLTRLGGSRMPPEVLQAMEEASRCFLDLPLLQQRVGERIAALTRNEAAYVSSGAAAGLTLATAACITGEDPAKIRQLPDLTGLKNEVIVHRAHRNGYDHAVRQVGVRLVEIGSADGTTRAQLEEAFSPQTAAFVWFQGAMTGRGDLPLPVVIEAAKARGVPVIVDAAAQLPPVSNLWHFTRIGADIAIFSGGKDLRGPQSSGLILGRRDLIRACALNGNPNASIGRPMKVGKEEMIGLLAAVERYLQMDHAARADYCERTVADWNAALNALPGVSARRDFPNEAGQPLPWSLVTITESAAGVSRDELMRRLEAGNPAIAVAPAGADSLHLNPMTLEPGEEKIVLERIAAILSGRDACDPR